MDFFDLLMADAVETTEPAGGCKAGNWVLRLIRQRHEVVRVLLGKMLKAPANHFNANRLGGSMK
jgi:hypothetical protein